MNICMIGFGIGKTHGTYVGGHVNSVINLSQALANDGFEIHIVSTPPIYSDQQEKESAYELQKGVTLHLVNMRHKTTQIDTSKKGRLSIGYGIMSFNSIVSKVRSLHKDVNFDVVHGHSGFPWVSLLTEYFHISDGVPVVHTLYCPLPGNFTHRLASMVCFSKLDYLIAVSDNVRNSLGNLFPAQKTMVIPPLVDSSRYHQHKAVHVDFPRLLYLGNLSKTKGLDVLLTALKSVKQVYPDVKLQLCLDVPLEVINKSAEIKGWLESYGLANNIIPIGITSDLPALMRQSDIFIAPFISTWGPIDYPLSIMEAMACGLPVIVSRIGGIPEIVKHGNNGLLVKPNEPSELADAILYLLKDPDLRIMIGSNAAKQAIYLNSKIIEKTKSVYHNIRG